MRNATRKSDVSITTSRKRDRQQWARETDASLKCRCMGCGRRSLWLETHEIERKSHCPTRWANRCNYLRLCQECHAGPFATMPHARQLAYKLYWDKEHFDLGAWLRLRDVDLNAPDRVRMEEIAAELKDVREAFECPQQISR